ncbi:restriction endonuclease subunit S [Klebsiella grimontii]|uniref:restriction endonuclease subunit S n=1 Tax=Klebsiella grimontii TaxID=2058152 RepID=UPI0012B7EDFD|nr:restriction endonuclease subunit S [Klebsiella grimontii]
MSGGKLPEGWVQAVLGDYLYLKNGFAFKSTEYVTPGAHSYPVIRISDLDGTCATDSSAVHVLQGAEGFTIEKGDLLIAMSGATTGKIGIYAGNIPAYQNQRVGNIKLRSSKYGDEKYRNYLITSASKTILDEAYGGAQPNISGKSIEALSFHLAPLAEQKIIAEKLDTLLAQVVSTKARLEQIPQILKRFRQAVLSIAMSGKLTEEWRKSSHILSSSWINSSIGELAQVATGKTPKRTEVKYWENGSIPWLTSSSTGEIYTEIAEQFITPIALKECTLKIFSPGTLLLAMYGEGKTRGQVTELKIHAACNQACAAIICDKEKIDLQFLKMRLMENYQETRKAAAGGNQPNLNLNKVREIPVIVPPLPEQHEIVRRVEQLFAYADTIEKQVDSALARVKILTQSILAKAFRGELTAQWRAENPDLISGENSAAALLEKIKAERTASSSKKTTRIKA